MIRPVRMPATALCVLFTACSPTPPGLPNVVTHDNMVAAGTRIADTVAVTLILREGRWFPDAETDSSTMVWAFAEGDGPPMIPSPMLRAPTGTIFRVTVRNSHPDSTLSIHGLAERPTSSNEVIRIPPSGDTTVTFAAGMQGNYFYWAGLSDAPLGEREGDDSQLAGALIVDPEGPVPPDRIYVLGNWSKAVDSALGAPFVPRDLAVINGRSFPHTTPINLVQGDTLRWRWLNPTPRAHPIHLHGLYFTVTSRGDWASDSTVPEQQVVTEMPLSGRTFSGTWVAEEPGNWVAHCHFAFHVSHFLSVARVPDPADPGDPEVIDHSYHGMRGMLLPISVTAREGAPRRALDVAGAREIHLEARTLPKRYGNAEGMAYIPVGAGPIAPDSLPVPSPTLVLRRGEPVRVIIHNRMRAPTAVHWHGMELASYADGVPGWSGDPTRRAPAIAPGDSFVASFTPPRAGTFMYHSHSNEIFQIASGLYGALLVVDPATWTPERERLIIIGGNGPDLEHARVNGKLEPDTLTIMAGTPYRFRIMAMNVDTRSITTLKEGDRTLTWRLLAKDGAELPPEAQQRVAARWESGPGETLDVEIQQATPGMSTIEVRGPADGSWRVRVPLRVTPRR